VKLKTLASDKYVCVWILYQFNHFLHVNHVRFKGSNYHANGGKKAVNPFFFKPHCVQCLWNELIFSTSGAQQRLFKPMLHLFQLQKKKWCFQCSLTWGPQA
jgi:hypothetical protein